MKQLFYLIALCCLLTSTPAMACVMCDDNNTEQPGRRQRGGRQQMDPAKMAEARVKQMTKKYGLSSEQQTKLKALFEECSKNRPTRGNRQGRMTKEQRDSVRTVMNKQREKFDASIKEILTEEQYAKYTADQKARAEEMQKRMQERKQNGKKEN